jgi:hypothetical protein
VKPALYVFNCSLKVSTVDFSPYLRLKFEVQKGKDVFVVLGTAIENRSWDRQNGELK